jgi:hypothetical protein
MLKIQNQDFYPIEGDQDFKVTLRPIGFADFSEIMIDSDSSSPSGGPATKEGDVFKSHYQFAKMIFERAVIKVEGCANDGKAVETGADLFKIAPKKVVDAILEHVRKSIRTEESELKN